MRCRDGISRRPANNCTNSEAIMTTRKPKPTYPPLIEFPTEQLQLVLVTVEPKRPARDGQPWQAEAELPSLPYRGKTTLH
jgi:hypothetical protein